MIKVFQIPALEDNYIHILKSSSGQTAVIDPSLEEPVSEFLKRKKWSLDLIFNTHHHFDHVGGNKALKKKWDCQIVGFSKDAYRIPEIDISVKENQIFKWSQHDCKVLFIPGHTLGHVAFWFQKDNLLFCGDTLFAMGCGRLFEGTAQQMLSSLKKITALPQETKIYCGHEYTQKNGQFTLEIEKENPHLKYRMEMVCKKRKQGLSTVPFTLEEELKTNLFLRCKSLLKNKTVTHLKLQKWIESKREISELELFTKIREMRNYF